jgi:hypothetical protein
MASQTTSLDNERAEPVLRDCVTTLERVATYRLPTVIDERLLWLSENKETLSDAEREELLGLTEFSEQRTLEKVQAQAVLKRLGDLFPRLVAG